MATDPLNHRGGPVIPACVPVAREIGLRVLGMTEKTEHLSEGSDSPPRMSFLLRSVRSSSSDVIKGGPSRNAQERRVFEYGRSHL